MGKNLRNSVGNNKNAATTRMAGPVTERLTLLEKRYSTVMVHQTYFKIMDEWMQCMFGAQLFPKPNDVKVNEEEPDEDNPFYELHLLAQRISALEDRLEQLGFHAPTPSNAKNSRGFKIPAPPPPNKPAVKRTYGGTPTTTIRRRSNYSRTSSESQVVRVPVAPRKTIPVILKSTATLPTKVTASTSNKVKESPTKSGDETAESETEKSTELKPGDEIKSSDGESKPLENEVDKPPVLEEQTSESETTIKTEDADKETDTVDDDATTTIFEITPEIEDMEVDDEEYDEEEDIKPIVPTPEELAAEGSLGRPRGSRGTKKASNVAAEVVTIDDDQPVVTYTARGRRHTLPRRYAEFTGHDNVASILKSQQRAAAANQAAKAKKATQSQQEKPKTPSKSKPPTAPKVTTPKKPPADGSRPECVYQCIGKVQGKEVDEAGDVVLWDAYPDVKVNLQQLISVIFRSNGMSTRLTRKMTTLVFEDQILANASPFGTKYYQERLPPERLESMVEFIAASGFDPEYTKKKIYMIVGQVCNEARAGRVRKLLPTTGQSGEEQTE